MAPKEITIIDTIQRISILFYINKKYAVNDIRILRLKAEEDGDYCEIESIVNYLQEYVPELVKICKSTYNDEVKKLPKDQQKKFNATILASWLSGLPSLVKPNPAAKIPSDFLIPIRNGTTFSNVENKGFNYIRIMDVIRPFKEAQIATGKFVYSVGLVECSNTEKVRNYLIKPLNNEFITYVDSFSLTPTAGNIYGYGSPQMFINKEIEYIDKYFPVNSFVSFCPDNKFSNAKFEGMPLHITRRKAPNECQGVGQGGNYLAKVLNVKNQSGVVIQTLIPATSGNEGYSEAKVSLYVVGGPHDGQKVTCSSFEIESTVPKVSDNLGNLIKTAIDGVLFDSSLSSYLTDAGWTELVNQIQSEGYAPACLYQLEISDDIVNKTNRDLKKLNQQPGSGNKLWMYSKDLIVSQKMVDSGVEPEDTEFYFIIHDSELKIDFPEDAKLEVVMTLDYEPLDTEESYMTINFISRLSELGISSFELNEFKLKADLYNAFIQNYFQSKVLPGTLSVGWVTKFIPLPIHSLSLIHNKKYLENRLNKLKANLTNVKNIHEYNKLIVDRWFVREKPMLKQIEEESVEPDQAKSAAKQGQALGFYRTNYFDGSKDVRCLDCGPADSKWKPLTVLTEGINDFPNWFCIECGKKLIDVVSPPIPGLDPIDSSTALGFYRKMTYPASGGPPEYMTFCLNCKPDATVYYAITTDTPEFLKLLEQKCISCGYKLATIAGLNLNITLPPSEKSSTLKSPSLSSFKNLLIGYEVPLIGGTGENVCVVCGKKMEHADPLYSHSFDTIKLQKFLNKECYTCNKKMIDRLDSAIAFKIKQLVHESTFAWYNPLSNQYLCIEEDFGNANYKNQLQPVTLKSFIMGKNCVICGENILGVWKAHYEQPDLDAFL